MAFGEENVFYDVDSIPTGRDFRQVISNAIQAADAIVVMIGPGFDVDRLSNQRDFVRIELLEALRHNKVIVPVTVDETSMPEATALPASLKTLAYINATRIRRDPDFHHDCERLIATLRSSISAGDQASAPGPSKPRVAPSELSARRSSSGTDRPLVKERTMQQAMEQMEALADKFGPRLRDLAGQKGVHTPFGWGLDMYRDLGARALLPDEAPVNLAEATLATEVPRDLPLDMYGRKIQNPDYRFSYPVLGILLVTDRRVVFAYRAPQHSLTVPGQGQEWIPGNLHQFAVPRDLIGRASVDDVVLTFKAGLMRKKQVPAKLLTLFLKRGEQIGFWLQDAVAKRASEILADVRLTRVAQPL